VPKLGSLQELPVAWIDRQDACFFFEHPGRQAHIRTPFGNEMQGEFWSLGDHDKNRRRVLLWRVPADNPHFDPKKPQILKMCLLAFSDETIEDDDAILLPILHKMMVNAK
jgi:hypothetical protein